MKGTLNNGNLYQLYQEHFPLLASNLLYLNATNLFEADSVFSKMEISKAHAYKVDDSDVFLYCLFTLLLPPQAIANYYKIPQNKVLMKKFFEDERMYQRRVAECFEQTLSENKAINKKVKSLFPHYELNNIQNKILMGLELIYFYKEKMNVNIYNKFTDLVDANDIMGATLHYMFAYVGYEQEDVAKIKTYIEQSGGFLQEKIKMEMEKLYDFAIGILKLAKKERYELYVDEQLVKMTEYMKGEREKIIESFKKDEQTYLSIFESLTHRLNYLEKENAELKNTSMKKTSKINGKKVLVVGDTVRKEGYRKIIEQYGGSFDFVDGIFDKEKIMLASESADVAVLVVPRIKHTISNFVKANKIPIVWVNSAGISTFEDSIDEYCEEA
jgi:hypothetical protein